MHAHSADKEAELVRSCSRWSWSDYNGKSGGEVWNISHVFLIALSNVWGRGFLDHLSHKLRVEAIANVQHEGRLQGLVHKLTVPSLRCSTVIYGVVPL